MTEIPKEKRVMVRPEGKWAFCRFEFDAEDGQGFRWHYGQTCGRNPVERITGIFQKNGYTIIDWKE